VLRVISAAVVAAVFVALERLVLRVLAVVVSVHQMRCMLVMELQTQVAAVAVVVT
jgi:hypothetical protein